MADEKRKKTAAKADENLHKDHRKRLFARYQKDGFASFEEHNILELLLFYAIPRADTNPTAHRLIQRFGSLLHVFTAPEAELAKVQGVGPKSASLIKSVFDAGQEARIRALTEEPIETYEQLHTLASEWYFGKPHETVAVLLLDGARRSLGFAVISQESIDVPVSYHDAICTAAAKHGATQAVLMHNHTNAVMAPSSDDIILTRELHQSLQADGISLLEHLIVWEFDALPILDFSLGETCSGYAKTELRYIDPYL